jgi:GxxExxY protein
VSLSFCRDHTRWPPDLTRRRRSEDETMKAPEAAKDVKKTVDAEALSAVVVDAAFHLHTGLGPGLLESVYECILARELEKRGLIVERQKLLTFEYDGMSFDDGLRVDLLVNGSLVVEIKSVERIAPVHAKQLLTYLRLLHLPLGLLVNFGSATFKEGCRRIVNGPQTFSSSRLRVNRSVAPPAREPQSVTRRHEEHEEGKDRA